VRTSLSLDPPPKYSRLSENDSERIYGEGVWGSRRSVRPSTGFSGWPGVRQRAADHDRLPLRPYPRRGQPQHDQRCEFDWIEEQVAGDYDHLLIGTALPWLLAPALHDIESWNELLCADARGPRLTRWSEKLRRLADLEHWASFRLSFDRLAGLIASVARGERSATDGGFPASVCVLSGDVHHAHVAEALFADDVDARVYQLTCSPLLNYVPAAMKLAFRIAWSNAARRATRGVLGLLVSLPTVPIRWTRLAGPYFGNEVATLVLDGRQSTAILERAARSDEPNELRQVASLTLSSG